MQRVLTVSEFVDSVRLLLRETVGMVTVQGEVTGYRTRRDQLVYFEIKDEQSRVLCFALSHELHVALEDGMEIRVTGTPALFRKNGGFHLRVVEIALVGEGALRKAFDATKRRLAAEGLFRAERKRPLPVFPTSVGLITSPDAAAYTDVLRILRNRWPIVRIRFASVAVQGPGSARQIVKALTRFSEMHDVEAVILTRGGGSLEDLQAFNDETVARAIFASTVPVVVGVGHERDETIADYVADVRASTPSNAAERVVPDRADILRRLDAMSDRLQRSLIGVIEEKRSRLAGAVQRMHGALRRRETIVQVLLQRFTGQVATFAQRVTTSAARRQSSTRSLGIRLNQRFNAIRHRHAALATLLRSLSPLAILQRGYSITSKRNGRIVRRSGALSPGDHIHTRFGTGEAESNVTEIL